MILASFSKLLKVEFAVAEVGGRSFSAGLPKTNLHLLAFKSLSRSSKKSLTLILRMELLFLVGPIFYLKSSNINNLIDYFIRIIGTNEAN